MDIDALTCQKCKQDKAPDAFHNCKYRSTGKQAWCKECQNANQRETRKTRRVKSPEQRKEYNQRYQERHKDELKAKRQQTMAEFKEWLQQRKEQAS